MNTIHHPNPSIQLKAPCHFRGKISTSRFRTKVHARLDDSQKPTDQQQQLNLSVLRFTLGIPGFDESYLPRWIGYGFGSLLLLNHFVGSDSATITQAQLSTEVVGLSLASFSIALPYLGQFLKMGSDKHVEFRFIVVSFRSSKFLPNHAAQGAQPVDQTTLPEGAEQIFVMSTNLRDTQKEELAWASYILLRNTNAVAVLISIRGDICARGYWDVPDDSSKANLLGWFEKKIEKAGLPDLKDAIYFPQDADIEFRDLVPQGALSLLVQPISEVLIKGATRLEILRVLLC